MDATIAAQASPHALIPAAVRAEPAVAPAPLFGRIDRFDPDHMPIARAWDDLAAHAAEPNVFAERWFVAPGAAHITPDAHIMLLQAWRAEGDAARLIGLLPLHVVPHYARLPVPHVEDWRHPNVFLGTPLLRAGEEVEAWTAMLARLDAEPDAPGFLHLNGLVEGGAVHLALEAACRRTARHCATVHRIERALLDSPLSAQAYYEASVNKKRRKELARLRNRLGEMGRMVTHRLPAGATTDAWCDAFLALEQAGWKGSQGSALASHPGTAAFFRDVVAEAQAQGRLDFIRTDLDGRAVAMLITLLATPGAFGFKTAYDENLARLSPGVLLQIDNLALLDRADIAWADSCAAADHPMINSLWREKRGIVRVTVSLSGWRRQAAFALCRTVERAAATWRGLANG